MNRSYLFVAPSEQALANEISVEQGGPGNELTFMWQAGDGTTVLYYGTNGLFPKAWSDAYKDGRLTTLVFYEMDGALMEDGLLSTNSPTAAPHTGEIYSWQRALDDLGAPVNMNDPGGA